MHTSPRRTALALAAIATLVALAGCGSSEGSGDSAGRTAEKVGSADVGMSAPQAEGAAPVADDAARDAAAAPTVQQPAVISTGTVSLEAKDVARARLQVRKVVDAHRGTVGEQETTTGENGELATARLVLRVPSEAFDDVVAALEEVATPTGTTTTSEDVTAEVVDVDARIRAQRKSVQRIETLLARAETIEQIVAIEAQLASRQADLDALESRQQWLADQTSMSTITVYVERPAARHDREDDRATGFLGGLSRGWDAFVDGAGAVLVVVGFLVPWLALLALLAVPARLVLRRRRRAGTSVTPAST
ncbi:DUF4349 domain-containing protein [Nocardioides daeguensis]|uniref:DUF4349 domain-containing protein n=1 Tax=Nocardioides daeguensis TaxID=908359 RepID=A0ABP6VBI8_9ACTN|nr:DUF4349 domain-containing protein [Nocardioides daeguensis]MBV6729416.1 DUF4349 domain-containing protein [Nocardioides daeguensis]MCR1771811.1 DUF4349 domain-containing protein [Nocardioides daeguensis]